MDWQGALHKMLAPRYLSVQSLSQAVSRERIQDLLASSEREVNIRFRQSSNLLHLQGTQSSKHMVPPHNDDQSFLERQAVHANARLFAPYAH
jgi:hypothetical protein